MKKSANTPVRIPPAPRYGRHLDIQIKKDRVEGLNGSVTRRNFSINDIVDDDRSIQGRALELELRPIRPRLPVGQHVKQNIRINERHSGSPRNRAISSSVVIPGPADPRALAKRLGWRPAVSTFSRTMLPSAARLNPTALPGTIPRWSRTGFGMVT